MEITLLDLDRKKTLRLLRRWWWLLCLGPLISGLTAYVLNDRQQVEASPEYVTTARLLVNPIPSTGKAYYSAATYGELVRSRPVLEPVIGAQRLPFNYDELRKRVSSDSVVDPAGRATELLEISFLDSDPTRAAAVTNAIADSFVGYILKLTDTLTGPTREALDQQISNTEDQIAEVEQQIGTLEQAPNSADPAVQAQLDTLRDSVNQQRQVLSDLLQAAQTMDLTAAAAQSQVSVVDEATVPSEPLPGGGLPVVPLAGFAGLALAGTVVLLLAYLDNTVTADIDFAALTGGSLLSVIPRVSGLHPGRQQLFVREHPETEAAEAIRLLRTNVDFALPGREVKRLAVSSPNAGEGKSTVLANLAVAMAQAGFSVLVVDADLRRPSQHTIFGRRNDRGLTTLLTHHDQRWDWAAVQTDVPNLSLIPSGPPVPNPADLLSLDRLPQLMGEITRTADIVLVDTPPVLGATDALIVGSNVDAVLLVCRAGRTKIEELQGAAAALHRGAIQILGVALNRQTRREATFHAYYPPAVSSEQPVIERERDRFSASA